MVSGIMTCLVLLILDYFNFIPFIHSWPLANNDSMNSFPIILVISIIGCIIATFMNPPESDEVLMKFYTTVRPWGFWKPIREKVLQVNPAFVANKDFKKDMFNVVTGIIWQITLMAAPVFLVFRVYSSFFISAAILIVTSIILKFNWWDKLESAYGDGPHKIKIKISDSDLQIIEDSK
jgi:hypothetical protein